MKCGKVYLVGAGPGDYELLTLKGLRCIKEADVIIYDRLVNEDYLKEAKEQCELIYVGKASNNHTLTQEAINELLVEKARRGYQVVRLKGGDPYVFGRGGEEGMYLRENTIPFEVVPGITSAIGGLCYAGIPITQRDVATSFHVVTGHLKDDEDAINWEALAKMKGTLVFLMGVSNLSRICTHLLEEQMADTTPVAIIRWATRSEQKVVIGNLQNIVERAKEEQMTSPSLIVVGEVVKLREQLNFFEQKSLFGKTIVTTRATSDSSKLSSMLIEQGAKVINYPTIRIEASKDLLELKQAIDELETYSYLVFSSQHTVTLFFDTLYSMGKDVRSIGEIKIGVIGKATYEALLQHGIRADYVPEKFISESLCELLEETLTENDKILFPGATQTRGIIKERLGKICSVVEVAIYDNKMEEPGETDLKALLSQGKIDYVTFTSGSTVHNLIQLMGQDYKQYLASTKLITIGPVTTKALESYELEVYKEASCHTLRGIMDCLTKE